VSGTEAKSPLLAGVSQFDVDFVIPRAGIDLPIGIDPFLLYKSRDQRLRSLHQQLLDAFNAGVDAIRASDSRGAKMLFDYPEVSEIGFGYTRGSKLGSGVGTQLSALIIDTLTHSPALLARGVLHIEEMQLVSAGIGPDRVSDITANLLKQYLIEYTQQQSVMWQIPMAAGVPLRHVYDPDRHDWSDGYFDLPVSPFDGAPILLVPRRIVRALPWINYDDFIRTEFRAYLAARRDAARRQGQVPVSEGGAEPSSKAGIVTLTRSDIGLVDRYVRAKERARADAQPSFEYLDEDACREAEHLKARLRGVAVGREMAADYQRLVLEILNFLFNPDLTDGQLEIRTIDGTERRDIIFVNESDETFWDYVRNEHSSLLLMFETKNVEELDVNAINQTATYLGDRLGRLGIIVTRHTPSDSMYRKAISVWNDSGVQRKVVLIVTDDHLTELLDRRCKNQSTTQWMRDHYRRFRQRAQ
jgi:hypothetical protein